MSKIAEFQKKNGLVADGVLGKNTLSKMKEVWKIPTDEKLANFLGQIAHETGVFELDKENLNYSISGLLKIFKKYFLTEEIAKKYANKPILIANKVYANRMGNRDELSGDGWKYRGVGSLQLTGKTNYKDFSNWLNIDKELTTEDIANNYFWESGLYYFSKNKLWDIASKVDDLSIIKLSKAINLGNPNSKATPHGLQDRIEKTKKYYNLIKK